LPINTSLRARSRWPSSSVTASAMTGSSTSAVSIDAARIRGSSYLRWGSDDTPVGMVLRGRGRGPQDQLRSSIHSPRASTMPEPTVCCRGASARGHGYCVKCDLLVGLDGFHVVSVRSRDDSASVTTAGEPSLPRGVCRPNTVRHHSSKSVRHTSRRAAFVVYPMTRERIGAATSKLEAPSVPTVRTRVVPD
jgi:hypothetical protein